MMKMKTKAIVTNAGLIPLDFICEARGGEEVITTWQLIGIMLTCILLGIRVGFHIGTHHAEKKRTGRVVKC